MVGFCFFAFADWERNVPMETGLFRIEVYFGPMKN